MSLHCDLRCWLWWQRLDLCGFGFHRFDHRHCGPLAFAQPRGGELYLHSLRIAPYSAAAAFPHDPVRPRKLLLHRAELDRWGAKVQERGYSIVPLVLYFKKGKAKVQLGLVRGKTHEDRREDIKERDTRREMDRAMRRR